MLWTSLFLVSMLEALVLKVSKFYFKSYCIKGKLIRGCCTEASVLEATLIRTFLLEGCFV